MDIKKLVETIKEIEGIHVSLEFKDDEEPLRAYPISNGSPGSMRINEWVEQFETIYPSLEVFIDASNLTLADLRRRFRDIW